MSKKIKDVNFYKKQVAYIKKLKETIFKLQNKRLEFAEKVNKILDMQCSDIEAICLKENECLKNVIEYQKNIIDNLTQKRVQYVISKNMDRFKFRV